jgi:hypothetical protein
MVIGERRRCRRGVVRDRARELNRLYELSQMRRNGGSVLRSAVDLDGALSFGLGAPLEVRRRLLEQLDTEDLLELLLSPITVMCVGATMSISKPSWRSSRRASSSVLSAGRYSSTFLGEMLFGVSRTLAPLLDLTITSATTRPRFRSTVASRPVLPRDRLMLSSFVLAPPVRSRRLIGDRRGRSGWSGFLPAQPTPLAHSSQCPKRRLCASLRVRESERPRPDVGGESRQKCTRPRAHSPPALFLLQADQHEAEVLLASPHGLGVP